VFNDYFRNLPGKVLTAIVFSPGKTGFFEQRAEVIVEQ
jgi:hypothetical protein